MQKYLTIIFILFHLFLRILYHQQKMHEDYNALMDRYRRLKQMAKSPQRDQEIDNLVRVGGLINISLPCLSVHFFK